MPGNYDINLLCLPVEAGFLQKWPSADVCVRQVACPRVPSNAVSRGRRYNTALQFASKRLCPSYDPHHAFCVTSKIDFRHALYPRTRSCHVGALAPALLGFCHAPLRCLFHHHHPPRCYSRYHDLPSIAFGMFLWRHILGQRRYPVASVSRRA
jgi:hypothetical protein